jgi:hypothetical protein
MKEPVFVFLCVFVSISGEGVCVIPSGGPYRKNECF